MATPTASAISATEAAPAPPATLKTVPVAAPKMKPAVRMSGVISGACLYARHALPAAPAVPPAASAPVLFGILLVPETGAPLFATRARDGRGRLSTFSIVANLAGLLRGAPWGADTAEANLLAAVTEGRIALSLVGFGPAAPAVTAMVEETRALFLTFLYFAITHRANVVFARQVGVLGPDLPVDGAFHSDVARALLCLSGHLVAFPESRLEQKVFPGSDGWRVCFYSEICVELFAVSSALAVVTSWARAPDAAASALPTRSARTFYLRSESALASCASLLEAFSSGFARGPPGGDELPGDQNFSGRGAAGPAEGIPVGRDDIRNIVAACDAVVESGAVMFGISPDTVSVPAIWRHLEGVPPRILALLRQIWMDATAFARLALDLAFGLLALHCRGGVALARVTPADIAIRETRWPFEGEAGGRVHCSYAGVSPRCRFVCRQTSNYQGVLDCLGAEVIFGPRALARPGCPLFLLYQEPRRAAALIADGIRCRPAADPSLVFDVLCMQNFAELGAALLREAEIGGDPAAVRLAKEFADLGRAYADTARLDYISGATIPGGIYAGEELLVRVFEAYSAERAPAPADAVVRVAADLAAPPAAVEG